MKKLPIGIQTFSNIIGENYYYIDKTPLIKKLADEGKYYFLSRPRRFGKSLLVDTISEIFKGNKNYFAGLFIENQWDWNQKYPVIKLSFGGGVIQNAQELILVIHELLSEIAQEFEVSLKNTTIQGKFRELILKIKKKYGQKVVILVDEYDKPILDQIDHPELAIAIRDVLRNLYSGIKNTDEALKFCLITGVTKFSKVNLFSGLNNLTDISLHEKYATICGYTEFELLETFHDQLSNISIDELKKWYNGYNFLGDKVYNPFDVLLFLDSKKFKNYWFETGTPTFLIKLLKEKKYFFPSLEKVQSTEALLGNFDVDSIDLITLLFQTGYLTIMNKYRIGTVDFYDLNYPNMEVKHSLSDVLLRYMVENNQLQIANSQNLFQFLLTNDFIQLKNLFHSFFASIPFEWYRKNEIAQFEGYYASIFYCYFTALGLDVVVEDSTNHGKIDMTVLANNQYFIFEFKVNELVDAGNALEQIKCKKYHEKYFSFQKDIFLIGVEFSKTDRNISRFEWEKIEPQLKGMD